MRVSMDSEKKGVLLTLVAAVLWGTSFPLVKWILTFLEPYLLVSLRFLFASLVLLPITILSEQDLFKRYLQKPYIILLGGINGLGYFLQFLGQNITTAINASLLLNTSAVFASFFSYFWLNEKIGKTKSLGIILTFLGVVLIVTEGQFTSLQSGTFIGDLLCLGSGILWGFYTVYSKKKTNPASHTLVFTCSMLVYTFLSVFFLSLPFLTVSTIQTNLWLGIGYLSIFCTALPFLMWYEGLKQIEASSSAIYLLLMIVTAALLSIIVLSEQLTPYIALGSTVICIGIWVTEQR